MHGLVILLPSAIGCDTNFLSPIGKFGTDFIGYTVTGEVAGGKHHYTTFSIITRFCGVGEFFFCVPHT